MDGTKERVSHITKRHACKSVLFVFYFSLNSCLVMGDERHDPPRRKLARMGRVYAGDSNYTTLGNSTVPCCLKEAGRL